MSWVSSMWCGGDDAPNHACPRLDISFQHDSFLSVAAHVLKVEETLEYS
jgi:hypothetical protein